MFQHVYVLIQESYEDAMRIIDMASESLDGLLFDDEILGTSGVAFVFEIFHLWVRVKCLIQNSIE